jgi:hypothetical protein
MNEAQVSEEWRKASLHYVAAMNMYVARGLSEGWENVGPEPEDDRAHLAEEVLNASGVPIALATQPPCDLCSHQPGAHFC